MEAITHNLTGVLIQIVCFQILIFPLNIIFTIVIGFFSHFIIDALAKITYHTPDAMKEDKFWVWWHIIVIILSISSLIVFIVPFWLGMLFANFVDIWDWLILRPLQNRKKKSNPDVTWGNNLYIHKVIDKFRDKTLFWLPNLNYNKKGVIPEIILICLLLVLIGFLIVFI